MATLISIPILIVLAILQTAILSQLQILRGTSDLILIIIIAWALQKRVQTAWQWGIIGGLITSIFSALPFGVAIAGYLVSIGIALLIRRRIWQVPILAMFVSVFLGTLITHLIDLVALNLVGNPMPWLEALNLITLPSLLVNLLLAIPAYALMADLARWIYPDELEV